MIDIIVADSDILQFDPMFGHRKVTVIGVATIKASGHATVQKRRICVVGDEKRVFISAMYQIPGYSPGQGTITISALSANQQTPRITTGNRVMIVRGQKFIARFTPTVPAVMTASPNTPDPTTPSLGTGSFVARQFMAKAG